MSAKKDNWPFEGSAVADVPSPGYSGSDVVTSDPNFFVCPHCGREWRAAFGGRAVGFTSSAARRHAVACRPLTTKQHNEASR